MSDDNKTNQEEQTAPIVDLKEVEELAEKDSRERTLIISIGVCIGLVLVLIYHNARSMYDTWMDETIPFVQCPRDFQTDAPVVMKTIDQADILQVDNYIRSFVFRYIRSRYPRHVDDVEKFYRYIASRSKGYIKRDFEARLNDLKDVKQMIAADNYVKFYPESSQNVRIRKVAGQIGVWRVEVDGYMHKRKGRKRSKTQPTIQMTVVKGDHVRSNPEGLYVTDYEVKFIKDPVSQEEISL